MKQIAAGKYTDDIQKVLKDAAALVADRFKK